MNMCHNITVSSERKKLEEILKEIFTRQSLSCTYTESVPLCLLTDFSIFSYGKSLKKPFIKTT
jgi:hypothetical protein